MQVKRPLCKRYLPHTQRKGACLSLKMEQKPRTIQKKTQALLSFFQITTFSSFLLHVFHSSSRQYKNIQVFISLVVQLLSFVQLLQSHSLPGSSAHGISQARILEWVAIFYEGEINVCAFFLLICLLSIQFTGSQLRNLSQKEEETFFSHTCPYSEKNQGCRVLTLQVNSFRPLSTVKWGEKYLPLCCCCC